MRKTKNHNFRLFVNGSSYKPSEKVSIYIGYKYGSGIQKKKRLPNIKVPFSHWDKNNQFVKKSVVDKNILTQDDYDYLYSIKSKFHLVARKMNEGTLTIDNAFKRLLKQSEDDSILNHLTTETPDLYSPTTSKKYKDYLQAIEGHYFGIGEDRKPKNQLNLSHLQDLDSVKQIATKVKKVVSPNTAIDYLKALDVVTDRAKLDVLKPFKSNKLIPSKDDIEGKLITYKDLLLGINKINTKQDYYSYAFWLFSFCLRGLDGSDITNISENNVEGNFKFPFYPDWNSNEKYLNLGEKAYYKKRRAKSRKYYRVLLNLFPTYYLHRLVKHLVTETHPELAYKGEDKLQIFNFRTKDDKGNDIEEGKAKWIIHRSTISHKTKRMFGEGIKSTRHTFTHITKNELTLTDSEQQDLLQHSSSNKALVHYQSEEQLSTDFNHIFALQEYEIITLVHNLFKLGEYKGFNSFKISNGCKDLLHMKRLSVFKQEEEREYQKLLRTYSGKPETKWNEETNQLELVEVEKPQRLLELEKKRKEDWDKTNPYEPDIIWVDGSVDYCNYLLKFSEAKEGIAGWEEKYYANKEYDIPKQEVEINPKPSEVKHLKL